MKPSFFIAEIGVNHHGSLDLAIEMIQTAKLAGANAVKFQAYESSKIAAVESPSYWNLSHEPTTSQYDLFKKHQCFDLSFYKILAEECKKQDIEFMTTCFDVDLLASLDPLIKRHKISSSDITNYQLIKKVAETNKPIILSCGASSLEEINDSVEFLLNYTSAPITLLHCVLNYPCPLTNANLSTISTLQKYFNCKSLDVGYSCHVPMPHGINACLNAFILGANIIEKHFTTCRLKSGNDHYHAITAEDLMTYRKLENDIITMMGTGIPDLSVQETSRQNARRSIYTKCKVYAGQVITEDILIALRPAVGIPANKILDLVGKKFKNDLPQNKLISFSDIC